MTRPAHQGGFSADSGGCGPIAGIGLVALLLIAGLCYGAWTLLPGLIDSMMPRSADVALGKMVDEMMSKDSARRCEGSAMEAWLKEVGDKLVAVADGEPFEYHWKVIDKASVNAFALPGGYVTAHVGLFEKAKSPEEVAAVIAHEIVHAESRHGMIGMASSIGLMAGAQLLLGGGTLSDVAVRAAGELARLGHSRKQESEADAKGRELMVRANMDPEGMVRMFELLGAEHGDEAPPEFLSSHPDSGARAEAARHGPKPMHPIKLPPLPTTDCRAGEKKAEEATGEKGAEAKAEE